MSFFISTIDAPVDNLESLYTAPIKTVGYKRKVAALAFFLIVSSMNEEAYGAETCQRQGTKQTTEFVEPWRWSFPSVQLKGVNVELNQTVYKLFARHVSAVWQRQESLNKLRESFYENFEKEQDDINIFLPLFNNMSKKLLNLKIEEAFVDVSRKKELIDFNLILEKGIFLSIAKRTDEMSDDVMFTIARNHETLVIDEMPMSELMPKITEIMMELKAL